jgi:hypothetical protein
MTIMPGPPPPPLLRSAQHPGEQNSTFGTYAGNLAPA